MLGISKSYDFEKILAVCNDDNIASKKIIIKNEGVFKDKRFDEEETYLLSVIG